MFALTNKNVGQVLFGVLFLSSSGGKVVLSASVLLEFRELASDIDMEQADDVQPAHGGDSEALRCV